MSLLVIMQCLLYIAQPSLCFYATYIRMYVQYKLCNECGMSTMCIDVCVYHFVRVLLASSSPRYIRTHDTYLIFVLTLIITQSIVMIRYKKLV